MSNLLDFMSQEDREMVNQWAEQRRVSKYKRDIPTDLYLAAQLGYYYGWQAVVDFRRNYTEGIDKDGKRTRHAFGFVEASALVKAAEKVRYRTMMDEGKVYAATNVSSYDREYAQKNAEYVTSLSREASK